MFSSCLAQAVKSCEKCSHSSIVSFLPVSCPSKRGYLASTSAHVMLPLARSRTTVGSSETWGGRKRRPRSVCYLGFSRRRFTELGKLYFHTEPKQLYLLGRPLASGAPQSISRCSSLQVAPALCPASPGGPHWLPWMIQFRHCQASLPVTNLHLTGGTLTHAEFEITHFRKGARGAWGHGQPTQQWLWWPPSAGPRGWSRGSNKFLGARGWHFGCRSRVSRQGWEKQARKP